MNNVHDFKKAIEQKQKQLKAKAKHFPDEIDFNKEFEGMVNEMVQMHSNLADKYTDLAIKYNEAGQLCSELFTNFKETQEDYKTTSRQVDLLINFISERGLDDTYIQYLKDVSKNEDIPDYRQAAIEQLESHIDGILWDEYGMIKEDDKYFQAEVN
ncbi:hypothetical protein [Schinkia azotoformans]|uniref:hypothetical protein n=1 Tax=Schinkia azotoformans TaxID=1454 RepID=UPI002DBA8EA9|nr:hypothetical protein [Schinkia azotoformans]MEC1786061.1 hypothetical protein [Schinkia azotoformans]MED4420097.1 hypothetical protein [Schinkia azotoformans]